MAGTTLQAILRRDRIIVLTALALLAALAWIYIISLEAGMDMKAMAPAPAGGAPMPDMDMAAAKGTLPARAMLGPEFMSWSRADFLAMFLMWAVMMVGMMTPSAAPMILIYARVGRQALGRGKIFASAGWFASGYLLAWTGFAAAATLLQWALEQAALLTPMMATASPIVGGVLLIAAGLYQWSPLKQACLAQCQSPFLFIQRHGGFRGDRSGALALGLRHGFYCIGCCWGLMLLLFLGGVMNLLWIAAIAALVLAEKLLPAGRLISRFSGLAFVAAGVALAAGFV